MQAVLTFVKSIVGFIMQIGIYVLFLAMFMGYIGLPIIAGKKVYETMQEKIDRNGNGVYMIWGASIFAGILALVAVVGLVSIISTVIGDGDPMYLNKMFMTFFTKQATAV